MPAKVQPIEKERRKELGLWLRECRERNGLSQMDVAKALDFDYYTMISQIELGRTRITSGKLREFAVAYKVDPVELGKRALKAYDYEIWAVLRERLAGVN